MDVNLSHAVSNEDLVGVLRTILLFLESINFKTASTALQNECSAKGYLQVVSAPAKVVIVHPSPIQTEICHRGNQTEFPSVHDKYELDYSDQQATNFQEKIISNSVNTYYTSTHNSAESSKNNMFDKSHTQALICGNNESTIERPIEEQEQRQSITHSKQNKNLETRRSPNTIESEVPTKISSKMFQKGSEVKAIHQDNKTPRKTHSNPILKTNFTKDDESKECGKTDDSGYCTKLGDNDDYQELRKKFRHLQNEHRKLMGVTTELCTALQTHILGQSENLNSMLNNCRNIYPDLFKSIYDQNSDNLQATQQTILSSTLPAEESAYTTNMGQIIGNSINVVESSLPSSKRPKCDCNNFSQDLLISTQTLCNTNNIVHSHSKSKEDQDGNISQGSLPSGKTIRNSDNILRSTSPSRKSQASNISQGSLPSGKTIRNSDNIISSTSPSRRIQDSNISQGSLPSGKAIRNSDNIISSTSPSRRIQDSNISQGSLPSGETIKKSDTIIRSASLSRKNQNSENISQKSLPTRKSHDNDNIPQGSLPSCKTIRNSDNIIRSTKPSRQGQDNDNMLQGPCKTFEIGDNTMQDDSSSRYQHNNHISQDSLPSRKTIRNSDNIIHSNIMHSTSSLRKSQNNNNTSEGSLPSLKTIRNSDNIIRNNAIHSTSPPKESQDEHNTSKGCLVSSESVAHDKTDEQEHTLLVEIQSTVNNGSCSTTILTPKLKRPHSSSIILITTTDEPQTRDSKILLRQLSNKSLDEYLLIDNSKLQEPDRCNGKTASEDHSVREITTTEDTCQIPEIKNAQQQTYLYTTSKELYEDTPEIFVTTEHLEKVQRDCKCKSSDESNCSSPRKTYFELDFRKLKKDMLNGDDNLKLGLIQALRWRITQSDRETRDQVISSYIRHDLLGLHSSPNPCGQSTTEIYYCPNKETPHPLQEGMARLVNTFASLTLGRDYLCQDDDFLISLLVPLVIGTHYSKVEIDDVTRDMLMATLQKLSIRNRQRIRMIAAGLVEYLVTFLATKHATISEYCMEYATALLMNLCLHREARELLHSSATDVVSLLADLLNTKHRSCMPYVNGAMFSLLGDPHINREAQRLNLAKLIEYHIKRTDGEMRRQLEFILKLHLRGDGKNDCGCDPNLEPENEVDLLEPELDSDDSINGQPAGEQLLKKYKLLFSINGTQVNSFLKCLCRPVTPRSTLSNEKLIYVTDNLEEDRMIQVCQDEIIQETSNEVQEDISQMKTTQNCVYLAEKSTPSENPYVVDFGSDALQSCTCTTPNATETKCGTPNKTPNLKTKHGNSQSEPITGFKSCVANSERSSRSNSPDMSYSEETKQFYYTPSAKTGIFQPQKQKKLHRVPPSFTRTIPLPQATHQLPPMCDNPFCPQPYSNNTPVTPKENSSARNPPYALDYPIGVATCYRESYENQMANLGTNVNCTNCLNTNKRSRYSCKCYNAIKGYVDQVPQDNIKNNRSDNSDKNFDLPPQHFCCHCQKSSNVNVKGGTAENVNDTTPINRCNDRHVNFSYEELLYAVRPDNDHVCPNGGLDCQCYDVVFQSRPKILRTPP